MRRRRQAQRRRRSSTPGASSRPTSSAARPGAPRRAPMPPTPRARPPCSRRYGRCTGCCEMPVRRREREQEFLGFGATQFCFFDCFLHLSRGAIRIQKAPLAPVPIVFFGTCAARRTRDVTVVASGTVSFELPTSLCCGEGQRRQRRAEGGKRGDFNFPSHLVFPALTSTSSPSSFPPPSKKNTQPPPTRVTSPPPCPSRPRNRSVRRSLMY